MGYTSETSMNEQALRDLERWKDKIEVRLDNRQVFFLFFGSALVACLLFVLGVIVGKRLESRGRAAAPEIDDPLALLDKMATSVVERPAESTAPNRVAAPAAKPATTGRPAARNAASRVDLEAAPVPPAAERAARREDRAEKPKAPAIAAMAKEPEREPTAAPTPPVAKAKPVVAQPPAVAAPPAEAKPKARFTLQIGAFPDQAEAQAFASRFGGAGKTYIVKADIPEKGTWYKVRMGEFPSHKDATAAKTAFEKQHNSIALVAPK